MLPGSNRPSRYGVTLDQQSNPLGKFPAVKMGAAEHPNVGACYPIEPKAHLSVPTITRTPVISDSYPKRCSWHFPLLSAQFLWRARQWPGEPELFRLLLSMALKPEKLPAQGTAADSCWGKLYS